jgi:2-haloacid dehalogenase
MPQLKALVFDAYGTLYDVHSVTALAESLFPGKGAALSQMWRQKQLEYSWLRSLMGTYENFNRVTEQALRYSAAALKLAAGEDALRALLDQYVRLDTFPEVKAALAGLKQGRKLAILSNGAPDTLGALVEGSGLAPLFDAVLSVDGVGVFKPDMRVYRMAADRLKLPPEQIGFVSSNCWDAVGAGEFGFTVFWINRLGLPADTHGKAPAHVIGGLDRIFPLLEGHA